MMVYSSLVAAPFLMILVAGCSLSPLAKRTAAFATAAGVTVDSSRKSYDLVEQSNYDAQVSVLVLDFEAHGFKPSAIAPFLPAREMKIRMQLLDGLKDYAEKLAAVSGDEKDLDAASKELGGSLKSLSKTGDVKLLGASAKDTASGMGDVSIAVDALADALINSRRARELPGILKSMEEPVNQICSLLEADIGKSDGDGLRHVLAINYEQMIRKQELFIRQSPALTPEQRRAEIEKLPELVKREQASDRSLAETEDALAALAKTHTALAESGTRKQAPGFRVLLAELEAEGQRLAELHAALTSK